MSKDEIARAGNRTSHQGKVFIYDAIEMPSMIHCLALSLQTKQKGNKTIVCRMIINDKH